ncbi:MAG: Acyl dehydratase [Pseudonocardiales bacterium]|nr:Acyl dehydratase [Pseudonocardiales bacterium]
MSSATRGVPPPPDDLDPSVRSFVLPVDALQAQRFAYAATDANPIYFDADAARQAGYERMPAPPTFVASMLDYTAGPPEEELKEDGVAVGVFPPIVRPDSVVMGGGQEIDFLQTVYQGDTVTVTRTVVNHYRRPSRRFGELDFIVIESRVVNQDGDAVMRIVDTLIAKQ